MVGQTRLADQLYTLKVQADPIRFEAGQFTKLALPVEGQMLGRAYSFVSAPEERPYEFYYVVVPGGPLTQRLSRLSPGDAVWISPAAAGFLVLSEVPEAEDLWLLATGTALAPFLSILKTATPWQRYRRVVLVHAVRRAAELGYREVIEDLQRSHAGRLVAVTFVSREEKAGSLSGRIPQAIAEGRLEAAAGMELSAARSQVMICGNPEMVADVTRALGERGMKKHRRRSPGQITVENYW